MDWLQFWASIVASLAWPAAIVLIVLLLRRALLRVLPRLRRLKYGGAEAEFHEKLEEAEEEVADLPVPTPLPKAAEGIERRIQENGDFSNNSAVFVGWLTVESAIINLARAAKLLEPNMTAVGAANLLSLSGIIDPATRRAIFDLLELRNIAVHPSEGRLITKQELDRFNLLADKVAAVLEQRRRTIS
jgi:hypothetical protein